MDGGHRDHFGLPRLRLARRHAAACRVVRRDAVPSRRGLRGAGRVRPVHLHRHVGKCLPCRRLRRRGLGQWRAYGRTESRAVGRPLAFRGVSLRAGRHGRARLCRAPAEAGIVMNWRAALSRRSFLAAAGAAACAPIVEAPPQDEQPGLDALASAKGLRFGTALQPRHLRDEAYASLVRREAGVLVGENAQKWHVIARDRTSDYTEADGLAAFADVNGLVLRGHTLLWYAHVPDWW